MRYFIIVRHAHADTPLGVGDFDRPLSAEGVAQCGHLRNWELDDEELAQFGPVDAVVSAALRTVQTFELAFANTPFVHSVHTTPRIYNGTQEISPATIVEELRDIDTGDRSLLVVAHNPTVTELLYALLGGLPAVARDGVPVGSAHVLAMHEQGTFDHVRSFVTSL